MMKPIILSVSSPMMRRWLPLPAIRSVPSARFLSRCLSRCSPSMPAAMLHSKSWLIWSLILTLPTMRLWSLSRSMSMILLAPDISRLLSMRWSALHLSLGMLLWCLLILFILLLLKASRSGSPVRWSRWVIGSSSIRMASMSLASIMSIRVCRWLL